MATRSRGLSYDYDAVRAAVGSVPFANVSDVLVTRAIEYAQVLVLAYLRRNPYEQVPVEVAFAVDPIVTALACRLVTNAAGLKRMSVEVEGTSFSSTPGTDGLSISEQLILNRYRRRTA